MQDRYENHDADEGYKEASLMPEPANSAAGDHPDASAMTAFRRGPLSDEENEKFEEHLENCSECLDLLLLGIDDDEGENTGTLDFEKEMIWARLKAERAEEDVRESRERAAKAWRRRRRDLLAAAAAIVAVISPLGWVSLHQYDVISGLTKPQLNVSIHDVLDSGQRSATAGPKSPHEKNFEIPAGTEFYTVVFPVNASSGHRLEVDLFDSRMNVVWRGKGLEVDEYGYATLGLSKRFLEEGAYHIRLFESNGDRKPVGDFSIAIRYL